MQHDATKVITKTMQSNGWPSKLQIFCRVQWALTHSTKGLKTYVKGAKGEGKVEDGKQEPGNLFA